MDEITEISEESKVKLREKQTELIRLIESLVKLDKSKEWNIVKELVFDKSISAIERQLLNESLEIELRPNKIYKLQGEWAWSKQFADIPRFVKILKNQLEEINRKLK